MKRWTLALIFPFVLVVFLSVFALVIAYPVWRICVLFALSSQSREGDSSTSSAAALLWWPFVAGAATEVAILGSWLTAMAIPFGERWRKASLVARKVSAVALTAMGALVLLALECAVFEIVAAFVPAAVAPGEKAPLIAACVMLGFCVVVSAVSILNAFRLSVRRIRLESPKVTRPLRLAHISDVHIGSRSRSWLEKIVRKIEAERPDAVLITGDLFDMRCVSHADLAPLSALRMPVLCCAGNHDLMSGEKTFTALFAGLENSRLLHDGAFDLGEVTVLGVGDVNREKDMIARLKVLSEGLDAAHKQRFVILLHHRPHGFAKVADGGFADLFLSGHTHAGQLFYFAPLVKLAFWHSVGLFHRSDGNGGTATLFVNPGTGTWGPLLRSSSSCQVAIIELSPPTARSG